MADDLAALGAHDRIVGRHRAAMPFRSERHRLTSDFADGPASELRACYAAEVDGVFTDHPG